MCFLRILKKISIHKINYCFFSMFLSLNAKAVADGCYNWSGNYSNGWHSTSASAVSASCAAHAAHLLTQNGECTFELKSCSVTHRSYYNDYANRPVDNIKWVAGKTCGGVYEGDTDYFDAVGGVPCTFRVANPPPPVNPPKVCAGNPIDVENGKKHQTEIDVVAKGLGQIEFIRSYSNSLWKHNYARSLMVIEGHEVGIQLKASNDYGADKSNVCNSGWAEIQGKYPSLEIFGSTSTLSAGGETCDIKKNGVVVKRIHLISDQYYKEITKIPGIAELFRPDGSALVLQQHGDKWFDLNGHTGFISRVAYSTVVWRFTAPNGTIEDYSTDGKLVSITASNGMKQELFYDATSGLLARVKDATNRELVFAYTGNQISSVTVDGNKTTHYTYNTQGLIAQVTRPDNTTRIYHYEDSRFPTYLTGITDERNKRYATWTYDAQGRAISSEHAGGAEKTLLSFNTDGSTTVTNALNKQTIYRFADIAGARRVVSVEGQPTASCAGANRNYTYTPEGWVASKTDWKGIQTTFQYNPLGQEISRTEAFGTTEARTVTTEWHPSLYLKTKVTEPTQETTFNYDTNGRLLNQSVRTLTN
jgi:YD repeat-containing protein